MMMHLVFCDAYQSTYDAGTTYGTSTPDAGTAYGTNYGTEEDGNRGSDAYYYGGYGGSDDSGEDNSGGSLAGGLAGAGNQRKPKPAFFWKCLGQL